MTIEKLTDGEKLSLMLEDWEPADKALRIIEQLTAALEETRADAVNHGQRANAFEKRWSESQAEVSRLTAALDAKMTHAMLWHETADANLNRVLAAESRAEALQARVAELEGYLEACPRCSYPCGDSCTNCLWSSPRDRGGL